jgi:hypothetical protein
MGPNIDEARKQARKAADEMFAAMDVYGISDQQLFVSPSSKDRWDEAKRKFVASVEELFVEDACNSF